MVISKVSQHTKYVVVIIVALIVATIYTQVTSSWEDMVSYIVPATFWLIRQVWHLLWVNSIRGKKGERLHENEWLFFIGLVVFLFLFGQLSPAIVPGTIIDGEVRTGIFVGTLLLVVLTIRDYYIYEKHGKPVELLTEE